jgi:hypothetical protein
VTRFLGPLAMLVLVVGCASSPSLSDGAAWAPECTQVGCLETGLGENAPVGAELSFSTCTEQVRSAYRYIRESAGWVLVSRSSQADASCVVAVRPN